MGQKFSIATGHLRTPQRVDARVLTCKERDTPFTRGIGLNVPILTGRDCELDTSRTAKRTPHFVLLPVGRRPSDHISFPQSPLGNFKLETTEIHTCDQTDRHVSSQPDTFIRSRAQFLPCSLDMKTGFLCKRQTFKKNPENYAKLSPLNVLTVF